MLDFPIPYYDELLYSFVCRYGVRNCETSYKRLMKELFGSDKTTINYDLPIKLDYFANITKKFLGQSAEEIAVKNTLYPFYSVFKKQEKSNLLLKMMKSNYLKESVRSKAGIASSNIKDFLYFKFCPKCCENDLLMHGEYYWHRTHQTPGVFICPIHGGVLQYSKTRICSNVNKEITYANKNNCIPSPILLNLSNDDYYKLLQISNEVQWIYDNYFLVKKTIINWISLWGRYSEFIKSKYMFCDNKTIVSKVIKGFEEYYGTNILKLIMNNPVGKDSYCWAGLLSSHCEDIHPIRHIMLIIYLAGSIKNFCDDLLPDKPFGSKPWICRNKICPDYGKKTISQFNIHRYRYKGNTSVLGLFRCNLCGYEYRISVFEDGTLAKPVLSKIGEMIQTKVKERMLSSNKINWEYAAELGISYDILKKTVAIINKKQMVSKIEAIKSDYDLLHDNYRSIWSSLSNQNKGSLISDLRKMNYKVYKWLNKNDKAWLKENSPKPEFFSFGINNNEAKDLYMKNMLQKVIGEIKQKEGKPVRITKGLLSKSTGFSIIKDNKMKGFPETKEFVLKNIETYEEFYLRKIDWAVAQVVSQDGYIVDWKVKSLLRLKPKYTTIRVKDYLNNSLLKENIK